MKINVPFLNKEKFAVSWTPGYLSITAFDASGTRRYASFFLQEATTEGLAARIREFSGGHSIKGLLILPRAEVLQKEIVLNSSTRESARGELEEKLPYLLPYSAREMAYGLTLDDTAQPKGLLYAIPGKRLEEILKFLAALKIEAEDIVSEDQSIVWNIPRLQAEGASLIVDQDAERILFVFVQDARVVMSRAILKGRGDFSSVGNELSMALIETGQKPVRTFLGGTWERNEIDELEKITSAAVLFGNEVPSVLAGARRWKKSVFTSLLPASLKVEKWKKSQEALVREALAAFGLFLAACCLFGFAHIQFLENKSAVLKKQSETLAQEVRKIREKADLLQRIAESEDSKKRILRLIKDLAERMPGAVEFEELRIDKGLMFQGKSPSHALLSEAVRIFETNEDAAESKLEHTRLRKRLNEDYFEFEVSAKWKN